MEINYIDNGHRDIPAEPALHRIADITLNRLGINTTYVTSLILLDDQTMHQYNYQYRQIDRTTDVLSFAALEGIQIENDDQQELGDIFINVDACERQAKSLNHPFFDEFVFLFTHGLLHLLGYDHQNKEDETEMIALQKEILYEYNQR